MMTGSRSLLFLILFFSLLAMHCRAEGRFKKFFMMTGTGGADEPRQGYDDQNAHDDSDDETMPMTAETCVSPVTFQDTMAMLKRAQDDKDNAMIEQAATAKMVQQLQIKLENLQKENSNLSKAADIKDLAIKERDAALDDLKQVKRQVTELQQDQGLETVVKKFEEQLDQEKERFQKLAQENNLLVNEMQKMKDIQKELTIENEKLQSTTVAAEEAAFKDVASQISTITDELEEQCKAKVDALTETLKKETEQKIELVKVGTRRIAADKLKEQERQSEEQHAKEIETLQASNQDLVRRLTSELDAAVEKRAGLEAEKKKFIETSLILEKKCKQAKTNAIYWEKAFLGRSQLNFTSVTEGAGGFLRVVTAPYISGDTQQVFSRSASKLRVDRAGKLLGKLCKLWKGITSVVLGEFKNVCTKALSSLKEKENLPPDAVDDVEKVCQNPEQPVDAFLTAVGLLLAFFFLVVRPVVSALLLIPLCIVALLPKGTKKPPSSSTSTSNQPNGGASNGSKSKKTKKS